MKTKSLVIGIVLGVLLMMVCGMTSTVSYLGGLRLVKNANGNAIIIDMRTSEASEVKVKGRNEPVGLAEDWKD